MTKYKKVQGASEDMSYIFDTIRMYLKECLNPQTKVMMPERVDKIYTDERLQLVLDKGPKTFFSWMDNALNYAYEKQNSNPGA